MSILNKHHIKYITWFFLLFIEINYGKLDPLVAVCVCVEVRSLGSKEETPMIQKEQKV